MAIDVHPREAAQWMAHGSLDGRGVTVANDEIYFAFCSNDDAHPGVHVLVMAGDQDWIDAFAASISGFELVQTENLFEFSRVLMTFWPEDATCQQLSAFLRSKMQ